MEMLQFKLDNFSKHKTIRCDVKYWNAMQSLERDGTIKIKDKFHLIPGTTQTQYYTSEITDIPNIAKSEQKKIIAEIQNHIMQQKGIDRKIEYIQKEISNIIEKSII